jgi:hypothetical protein
VDRPWFIQFWDIPVKWVFVALPTGILLTLLFYYDHNVSSLTAQAKNFPLKKPAGFHWDFFLLGCTSFAAGIIGIPLPNGLIPQAPVHTDALTEYRDVLSVSREKYDDEKDSDPTVHNHKVVRAERVHEQRISHFLMCLGLVGCMTGPLLTVLHTMPRALFAGVFFVVGFSGIPGFNITQNLLYCMTERQFIDAGDPRLTLTKSRIFYYTMFQVVGVAISVAISQTIGAIGFPVIIVSLIPLRWCILPRIFTEHELLVLDAPTADSDTVLCSLGGQPERPEVKRARVKREGQSGDGENGRTTGSAQSSDVSKTGAVRSREGFKDAEEEKMEMDKERIRQREGVLPTSNTGHD